MKKNTHLNDSSANRREKKKERRWISLIVFSVVAVIILIVALNIRQIMAPFEGIGQRLPGRNRGSNAGFPVRLPGSASYSISEFDNGFMLLTETYAYTYDADGRSNYDYQHGYSSPKASVGGRRILIFDENGRKFSFLGRGGLIYERESEERIIFGVIGNGSDRVAIVYRSAVYSNILEIYDGQDNWKYRKRFSDESVMQVAFASSDNEIIVTTIGFDSWDMSTAIRRFDTSCEDENGIWRTELPLNTQPFAIRIIGDNIYVLCDDALFVLNYSDGGIIASYNYTGSLIDFAFTDSGLDGAVIAVLINDYSAGAVNLVSLNRNAHPIGVTEVSAGASQVEIREGAVAVLQPSAIIRYDGSLTDSEIIELSEEFSRFIHVGREILLLGYNTVEKAGDDDDSVEPDLQE
jgi:hypothetical protein